MPEADALCALVEAWLDDDKAEDIVVIDLKGRSSFADYMVIATGRSDRHVGALAEHLIENLKASGLASVPSEGRDRCDWVLLDGGDVVIHLFRPEVREFYNLEKLWSEDAPDDSEGDSDDDNEDDGEADDEPAVAEASA